MMFEMISSSYFIICLFFIVAFTYSSVGLGGGSSYTALMAMLGFDLLTIPMVTLSLNLSVTSIGSFNFIKNKHGKLKLIAPFLISSIPMAYLGGALSLPKEIFYWILLISLVLVVIRIYFWGTTTIKMKIGKHGQLLIALIGGSALGLISGIVGIGGGIFLIPLIIILGLGTEREAAACGMIFIWLNSLSSLSARLQYNSIDLRDYIPLILAVILGGIVGSSLGSTKFHPKTMQKILGGITIVAIFFLINMLLRV